MNDEAGAVDPRVVGVIEKGEKRGAVNGDGLLARSVRSVARGEPRGPRQGAVENLHRTRVGAALEGDDGPHDLQPEDVGGLDLGAVP